MASWFAFPCSTPGYSTHHPCHFQRHGTCCKKGPGRGIVRGTKDLSWASEKQTVILSGFQTMNVPGSICSFSDNMLCAELSTMAVLGKRELIIPSFLPLPTICLSI